MGKGGMSFTWLHLYRLSPTTNMGTVDAYDSTTLLYPPRGLTLQQSAGEYVRVVLYVVPRDGTLLCTLVKSLLTAFSWVCCVSVLCLMAYRTKECSCSTACLRPFSCDMFCVVQ